jgi:hypothetical protein
MACTCTWTAQGNIECDTRSHSHSLSQSQSQSRIKHTNIIESFGNEFLYSFNVFLYDSKQNTVAKHIFINVAPSKSMLILQIRPTSTDMIGDNMRLVITDVTMYINTMIDNRPLPLGILLEVDPRTKPIPVVFSDKPPVDNVYYRTAEINISSYNGFKLYFDHMV